MEDRYEIRGKIGQGALGSVYRAFDKRMNCDVAIKCITSGGEDGLTEDTTRQLLREADLLTSLQHPHIVNVHDFGNDEIGLYVVMELVSGKTLDEIIRDAPLTWEDFRELALQSQEALIAAHDLGIIHSGLQPGKITLSWLPSGRFQIKLADFGLAVLTRSRFLNDIEAIDTFLESVFFMPPEQFERQPLSARSDMYSIGCIYYQALTCLSPFTGTQANEVMDSHLRHSVIPLHELRPDIPRWACDWVMWHINRYPQDRPASSREALAIFSQNEITLI